jgi:hypothetical protein
MNILALTEWLGAGGVPVPGEEAQRRADICLTCPLNRTDVNLWDKVKGAVAESIRDQLEVKHQMEIYTHNETQLGICEACGCVLKLKVHVPLPHILNHTPDLQKFDKCCWIRDKA